MRWSGLTGNGTRRGKRRQPDRMFLGSTGTGAVPSSRPAPHGPSRAAEVKDGRRPPRSGLSLTEASTMAPSPERQSVAKRKRQLLTRPLRPMGGEGRGGGAGMLLSELYSWHQSIQYNLAFEPVF